MGNQMEEHFRSINRSIRATTVAFLVFNILFAVVVLVAAVLAVIKFLL